MEILYFFEKFRTPFLDTFFSFVTHFGEEMFFIILGIIFFWCIDKKQGYYLLSIGFIGTILNQFLKLFFRIPRPWIKDKNFSIVESARAEATGYSFPSGHTQSSVGLFGGLARLNNNKIVRFLGITLCILVPLSRLYLGVHTPLDVCVSVIIALILIFTLYPIINKATQNPQILRILLLTIFSLSVLYLCFVSFYNFPANVDTVNLAEGTKNAYKMFGCTLGIYLAFELDNKFIHFETTATLPAQILKLFLGLIPLLAIKEGLKAPLNALFSGTFIGDGIRYFILVLFAGSIWPLTFRYFSKIFIKSKK